MKPTTINTNFNSIPTNSNNLDTGKSKESIIKLPIIQDNKVNEIISRKPGFAERWAVPLFLIILLLVFVLAKYLLLPYIRV